MLALGAAAAIERFSRDLSNSLRVEPGQQKADYVGFRGIFQPTRAEICDASVTSAASGASVVRVEHAPCRAGTCSVASETTGSGPEWMRL